MRNTPQSTGIANAKVTSISVTGNDTVAFYNGTQLLRVFGQVRNIEISRDRQYIVITQLDESIFAFDVWSLSQITSVAYPTLNKFASNIQDLYAQRMNDVYYQVAARLFRGCCCSTPGPESTPVSFLYEYNDDFDTSQWYYASGTLFMSSIAVDGQYLGDLLGTLPTGSWISFMDRDDAQNYVVFEVSDYAVFSGVITYSATIVSGSSVGFALETVYVTSFDKAGSGSASPEWGDISGNITDQTDLVDAVQNSEWITGTATGTDTYSLTLSPALTAYQLLQVFFVRFTNGNTGASTININGLGAKSLRKEVMTPLSAGDIQSGGIYPIMYDGTNFQIGNVIPSVTGFVESVTGDSVDNADPANPVVNAIPLAGTSVGDPVTGDIEFDESGIRKLYADAGTITREIIFDDESSIQIKGTEPGVSTAVIQVQSGSLSQTVNDLSVNETIYSQSSASVIVSSTDGTDEGSLSIIPAGATLQWTITGETAILAAQSTGVTAQYQNASSQQTRIDVSDGAIAVQSAVPNFPGAQYGADYSADFTDRSLVDKEYVDNAIGGSTPNLQQVTDAGNTTTNSMAVTNDESNVTVSGNSSGQAIIGVTDNGSGSQEGYVIIREATGNRGTILAKNLSANRTHQLPNSSGPLANSADGITASDTGNIALNVITNSFLFMGG